MADVRITSQAHSIKNSNPVVGRSGDVDVLLDLPKLLETRMLVQSNSGGGKSWALRRLLEQTAPLAQQIVIDVEGEFTTLREKFDYVICAAQDGDAAATPQTAAVLARKLRELRVSAILDIHDLKAHERHAFVRKFFDALMQAPRDHWSPALVILDEAHLFAPEQGKAESVASVIDMATRGRKRGLALIAATQRLSKLHKDVAAELLNKLVGRTGLDVDVRRAADELGMTARDAMASLRDLEPGEFFAFGPALSRTITKLQIGQVQTTHPKVGDRLAIRTPAPSRKVIGILQELADIPKEAEEEAVTVEKLRADNAVLKRQVAAGKTVRQGPSDEEVKTRIDMAVSAVRQGYEKTLRAISELAGKSAPQVIERPALPIAKAIGIDRAPRAPVTMNHEGITQPQQRILDAMAKLEALGLTSLHKTQVAAFAGVSPNSSAFANNLGRLRTLGLTEYPQGGHVAFTDGGRSQANETAVMPTLEDLHQAWLGIVTGPQQRILREVIADYPSALPKEALAERARVSGGSSAYANNLGRLRTLGAIDYPRPGYVKATDILFPASVRVA